MFRTLRRKVLRLALVSGAGAAANYFFDRERGVERREQAGARVSKVLRRQAPVTDWESRVANGFVPPTPAEPAPQPQVPAVADILSPDDLVEVLVVETAPGFAAG